MLRDGKTYWRWRNTKTGAHGFWWSSQTGEADAEKLAWLLDNVTQDGDERDGIRKQDT